jgi:hypothetical protein
MAYRLGKNRPVTDQRTMRFGAYLTAALPAPPDAVRYDEKVAAWPMYDNDRYGDCTCAAAGHMIQSWTAAAGAEFTPSESGVLGMYEHFVGNPPPPDEGCNMLSVLTYWRKAGLDSHPVTAFTALDLHNDNQAKSAVNLFGAIYIGVALPDFTVPPGTDFLTIPWEVPPGGPVGDAAPNPGNGHCIPAVGYDADHLYVVTWGAVKTMSWAFYDAYADESFAVLSQDFIGAGGVDGAGFNLDQLMTDLGELASS